MVKPWREMTASDGSPTTATAASAVGITMGMSGVAAPAGQTIQPLMTASQYVAALARDFRALPDVPDDDSTVDFDPDL